MQLSEAIDLFLGGYDSKSTREAYGQPLLDMCNHIGTARLVEDVSPVLLEGYAQTVRKRDSVKSPATYNKYVKTLRVFFNWAVRMKLVDESPARVLKRQTQSKAIDRVKAMPDTDYERLLDYAKWDTRYYALVLFLGDTGCRIGGAAGLRWEDVDLDNLQAMVTEKGKPPRRVLFGEECRRVLIQWKLRHSGKEGDYVFHKHGRRIQNKSLGKLFTRICERAGIGKWGPHSIRHRKGYNMAEERVPPSVAAIILGHDDVLTTINSYYPHDWDTVRREAEKLHYQPKHKENIVEFPKIIQNS